MNLKEYIKGKRHGKEANQLEREAMNDPFLQDAIEGLDSVQGNHLPVIDELERSILNKSTRKNTHYKFWIFGVAASLILLLSIGTLFRMYNLPENKLLKQTSELENSIKKEIVNSEKEIIIEPEIIEPEKNIALNIEKPKPETSTYKETQVSEEIIVNDNISASSVAEIEESAIVMDKIIEKESPEPTQIKIRGINTIQNIPDEKVSGIVLDETGQPMVGVSVRLKNSQSGTVSDLNGRFELVAPKNEPLVASYIGYEKKEINITHDSAIIHLKPDNLALNEVVVVGYGTQKKKTTVGSITNPEEVLSGRVPGVEVKQLSKGETFGESEFKKYFEKNRNQTICENKPSSLIAVFYVDLTGKPINIKISECSCYELENEFIRLIKASPVWSKVNRNVYITIRIK